MERTQSLYDNVSEPKKLQRPSRDFNKASLASVRSGATMYYSAEDMPLEELKKDKMMNSSIHSLPEFDSHKPDETTKVFYNQQQLPSRESTLPVITEVDRETPTIPSNFLPARERLVFFDDGIKRIDFILTYQVLSDPEEETRNADTRKTYQENLEQEGLELEFTDVDEDGLGFVKVHAPWEVLSRYADIMKLKLPMKEITVSLAEAGIPVETQDVANFDYKKFYPQVLNNITERMSDIIFPYLNEEKSKKFTTVYSRDKEYLFDIPPKKEEFFFQAQRSQIVDFILKRKRFSSVLTDAYAFGIKNLLADGVYVAAYPLHEGNYKAESSYNKRSWLMHNWASLKCIFKYQPLDEIRRYFGVKIGLYFAWLGFYTYMLIPASMVGVGCFIYGAASMYHENIGAEICSRGKNVTMCPLCERECEYWRLSENCMSARITALFDNSATIFFSFFMSLWGAIFLEMWKRYSATITHNWDLTGFDATEEHPRPEYLARLSSARKRKLNIITQMYEPYVPFWKRKLPFTLFSASVVLFLVTLAVASVFGVILYRVSARAALSSMRVFNEERSPFTSAVVSSTAALINLCCILLFNRVYTWVATRVTELEMPRTQTEFDNSLTLKMFMLQFVNYYSSIFYIAFFKGRFAGYPKHFTKIFGRYQHEECGSAGCLFELTIQLAIIMVGKQAITAIMEMVLPWFWQLYNAYFTRKRNGNVLQTRWEEDYILIDWGPTGLFFEYLEMILQFGFVTIFVAAFPLAPVFALLNNCLEIRLDARKLITSIRRPVAQRVRNIGVWYRILDSIGKLSVLTNGFIIAFASNVIPRLYYKYGISSDGTIVGFMEFSLSYFDTKDFDFPPRNITDPVTNKQYQPTVCRYADHRHPFWHPEKYEYTEDYWHITCLKFAFVVIFENVVAVATTLIRWLIPDTPKKLKERIRQENFLVSEIIIEQELRRAKDGSPARTPESENTRAPTRKRRNSPPFQDDRL